MTPEISFQERLEFFDRVKFLTADAVQYLILHVQVAGGQITALTSDFVAKTTGPGHLKPYFFYRTGQYFLKQYKILSPKG